MENDIKLEQLETIGEQLDELSDLLIQVVEDGASIGFLPPLKRSDAREYWENVLNPEIKLYVAKINNKIVGSVQLHLCTKQNGRHRAEIAKLMTHPDYRRMGIGKLLMLKVEEIAKTEDRSLIVLDTREGDPSNHLYLSISYAQAGRIPYFAKSQNGQLDATIIYYKSLR